MPIHDVIRQRLQPVAASVTSNRIMLYAFFSTCAMLGAIANACINQSNFYSVMIHLSRSGRSVLVRTRATLYAPYIHLLGWGYRSSPISASLQLYFSGESCRGYSSGRCNHARSRYVLNSIITRSSANVLLQRLYDQTWMFVTESLLAFTIFRDEFDIPFVLMFGFLLFIKCFHWLLADRVESVRSMLLCYMQYHDSPLCNGRRAGSRT